MNSDGSSGAGNVSLGVSMGGGVVATINEYAVVIGLTISLLSLSVGLYFHIQTIKWRKQQSAETLDKLRADIIEELK